MRQLWCQIKGQGFGCKQVSLISSPTKHTLPSTPRRDCYLFIDSFFQRASSLVYVFALSRGMRMRMGCMHVSAYVWRMLIDIWCLSQLLSTLFYETVFPTDSYSAGLDNWVHPRILQSSPFHSSSGHRQSELGVSCLSNEHVIH